MRNHRIRGSDEIMFFKLAGSIFKQSSRIGFDSAMDFEFFEFYSFENNSVNIKYYRSFTPKHVMVISRQSHLKISWEPQHRYLCLTGAVRAIWACSFMLSFLVQRAMTAVVYPWLQSSVDVCLRGSLTWKLLFCFRLESLEEKVN